jgi:hypothetical protein
MDLGMGAAEAEKDERRTLIGAQQFHLTDDLLGVLRTLDDLGRARGVFDLDDVKAFGNSTVVKCPSTALGDEQHPVQGVGTGRPVIEAKELDTSVTKGVVGILRTSAVPVGLSYEARMMRLEEMD